MTIISMPESWYLIPVALIGSLLVRVVLSALNGLRYAYGEGGTSIGRFTREFSHRFKGRHDYWHTYVLGSIEIIAFSILMAGGNLEFVGAWLGLKTVVQWKHWQEERSVFTIYLIGTALVVILSFALTRCPWLFQQQLDVGNTVQPQIRSGGVCCCDQTPTERPSSLKGVFSHNV